MPNKQKKKEENAIEIKNLTKLNTLKKLQIVVTTIFVLSTIAIPLALINFAVAGLLILIAYVMLLGLMVKLWMTKKL